MENLHAKKEWYLVKVLAVLFNLVLYTEKLKAKYFSASWFYRIFPEFIESLSGEIPIETCIRKSHLLEKLLHRIFRSYENVRKEEMTLRKNSAKEES